MSIEGQDNVNQGKDKAKSRTVKGKVKLWSRQRKDNRNQQFDGF